MPTTAFLLALGLFCLLVPATAPADETATDIVLTKGADKKGASSSGRDRVHRVASGETLSAILVSNGMSLSDAEKMIPLILELNPGLSDPDTIFPGQELLLPASFPSSPLPAPAKASAATALHARPYSIPLLRSEGNLLPLLQRSLSGIGEEVSTSGTLSLPYPHGNAITIDNSTYPLLQVSTGRDLILDIDARMPEDWKTRIEDRWPGYRVIPLPREGDFPDLLQEVLDAGGFHSLSRSERLSFGRDPEVSITPDFIVIKTPESLLDGELYVINVLESPVQALPREIRQLAEEHSITVVEILPVPGPAQSPDRAPSSTDHRRTKITASDTRTLLTELLPLLGFTSAGSGPYRYPSRDDPAILLEILPQFQLRWEAQTLLVFFETPEESLLGELGTENVRPLVFAGGDSLAAVLGMLLTAAGRSYSGPTVEFYRPDERFSVAVEGFYLLNDGRPTFLTAGATSPRLASLLAESGIALISCIIN